MLYQLEITTHCNYGCFYCAGRDMKQQHMSWELFERILAGVPDGQDNVVSLQGEGEPTVHPRFWDMVDAVRRRGLRPFTITNCSHVDAARFAASFPTFAISIDTLDPAEAHRIGRYKLDRMLKNLDALCEAMDPGRIHIMTVDYGQPLEAVRAFARTRGFGHTVQPLQAKDDYAGRYPTNLAGRPDSDHYTYRCRYLEQPLRRYYDADGREYPCCYIKDNRRHEPIETLRSKMQSRIMPAACEGCHEVLAPEHVPKAMVDAHPALPPKLSLITVCARLTPERGSTLSAMAGLCEAEVVVVETGPVPGDAGQWPGLVVVRQRDAGDNLARARNHGARRARGEWLCFIDADAVPGQGLAAALPGLLQSGGFVSLAKAPGFVLCGRTDFLGIEGYDELFGGCEQAEWDLALRLQMLGRAQRAVPAGLIAAGVDPESPRFLRPLERLDDVMRSVFVQIKRDLAFERAGRTLPHGTRRAIFDKISSGVRRAAAEGLPRATVNITLPEQLVLPVKGRDWGLKRVWSYDIDLGGQSGGAGSGGGA